MWQKLSGRPVLLLVILSIPFFIGLGAFRLFDWDEVNFAECSREMILTGEWWIPQINFELFWEKPPLFFWLQAVGMKFFGVGSLAARLPNAITGFFTLLLIYRAGRRWHDARFATFWTILYAATLLPHLYFKSGIIDPLFNLFMFAGYYYLIMGWKDDVRRFKFTMWSGAAVGAAVLTKGPVGLLIVGLAFILAWIFSKGDFDRLKRMIPGFAIAFLFLVGVWFAGYFIKGGWDLFTDFIQYQIELFSKPVAGHKQPFWYHFAVVLVGCFPVAIPALPLLFTNRQDGANNMLYWMRVLWWVVLILFTIVTTKIIHYSSLAYLPLAYLGAWSIYHGYWRTAWRKLLPGIWFGHAVIWSILLLGFPVFAHYRMHWLPSLKDRFGSAQWSLPIDWSGWEGIGAIFFIYGWWMAYRMWKRSAFVFGAAYLWIGTVIVLGSYSFLVLPKIEGHTQATPIEWYQKADREGWGIETIGFKTYADLFYGKKMPPEVTTAPEKTLIVTKITNKSFKPDEETKLVEEKGGFRFYLKDHQD